MSVTVDYIGRFGNNVFQYVAARLFAEENGLSLRTPANFGAVLPVRESAEPNAGELPGKALRLGDSDELFARSFPSGNYHLSGFFQRSDWYWERRKRVLEILDVPVPKEEDPDALGVHLRLGDYRHHKIAIHPSWYVGLLKATRFSKLVVVTDQKDGKYLKHFKCWKPEVVSESVASDWKRLLGFRRLIISNSTFAWWAAFCGKSESVVTFARWIRNPIAQLAQFPKATPMEGSFEHEA